MTQTVEEVLRWIPGAGAALVVLVILGNACRLYRRLGRWPVVIFRAGSAAERLGGLFGALLCGLLIAGSIEPALLHGMRWIAPPLPVRAFGAAVMLGGIPVFLVALRDLGDSWRIGVDRDEEPRLVTRGIYRRIRHPIYTAILCWLAGWLIGSPGPLPAATLVVGAVGVLRQSAREEAFLLHLFPGDYEAYRGRSGRFLPKLK
jgi:protein-S-isoprenylcysteine O-methyltransferase Ste14